MTIKPAALKKGDLIGIMSPSSAVDRPGVEAGIKILEQRGFQVFVHPQTWDRHKSSAGTSQDKIAALHEVWSRKDIKAILTSGGGNRALHLLKDINYGLIRRNPKIIMGFSDVTALLNAFHARTSLVTFHGPVVKWIPRTDCLDNTFGVLAGKKMSFPMEKTDIIRKGTAHGPLIGGNLSLIQALSGTKYMPKLDGAILFLEDVGEETSRVDRALTHLRLSGALNKISGLALGQFTDMKDTGRKPYGFTLEEIVAKHTEGLDIPVVMNAPFGHIDSLYTLPIGCPAHLTARAGKAQLSLSEPAVRI